MSTRRKFLGAATAVGAMAFLGGTQAASADEGDPGPDSAALELQARNAIFAVDTDTQKNYDALRAELIKHLSPVIVVQNDDRGGLYTLIHNGEQESLHPVSEIFELAKSIAHAPLGIYSVIAPYLSRQIPNLPSSACLDQHDVDMVAFKGPGTNDWVSPLQAFGTTLTTARQQLDNAHMPQELEASSTQILDVALRFINESMQRGSFDMKSFENFTGGLNDAIGTNVRYATQAQIDGVEDLMKRWRGKVGKEDWPGLYVVVLSIWTTSALNQNSIIVKQFMDPAKADSHLIDLPTAQLPADPVFVALDNLARIVQDNVAAEMVFPVDQKLADALKGPEDLLAQEILHQLACPYQSKTPAKKAVGAAS
ncbi:hypothetical protein OH809_42350 [Streptomyces sp. NBC_00873]|uniref:hypothetical protein n=1 Tax=unclassified Streptomyces TaxID=2593676 RepID=UPI0038698F88|nr:hypothetical protein OH809_01360 [Streptomyces sp. NBC_00873]WSY96721.1 hypothetical protein OH809_42350 [Streptomyces sp. NBC_00873]WTA41505.1 hypothetical protein OH821_01350 [Streptomyces sp. NBC_00842]WTA48391.1 hypothetical protein OH821_42460 [Streptomyces sp. NBC_00842]